jgi:hypothetical protein
MWMARAKSASAEPLPIFWRSVLAVLSWWNGMGSLSMWFLAAVGMGLM